MTDPEITLGSAKTRRGRFQVGLRVLFWLMAAIAFWITVHNNHRENGRLAAKIERLQPLAHELIIDDPTDFAAVRLDNLWRDELRWDVFVPPGTSRVCLATRKVPEYGFPEASSRSPIGAGRRRLELRQETLDSGTRIDLILDGVKILSAEETKDWAETGWVSSGVNSKSEQRPGDQPLVLHRRRFSRPQGSTRGVPNFGPAAGLTEGILLWIERTAGPDPSKSK